MVTDEQRVTIDTVRAWEQATGYPLRHLTYVEGQPGDKRCGACLIGQMGLMKWGVQEFNRRKEDDLGQGRVYQDLADDLMVPVAYIAGLEDGFDSVVAHQDLDIDPDHPDYQTGLQDGRRIANWLSARRHKTSVVSSNDAVTPFGVAPSAV